MVCRAGSDIEDEEDDSDQDMNSHSNSFSRLDTLNWTYYPNAQPGSKLRGNRRRIAARQMGLSFQIVWDGYYGANFEEEGNSGRPFIYEAILALFVKSYADDISKEGADVISDTMYNPCALQTTMSRCILSQIDFLLPICLKSMVLRFDSSRGSGNVMPTQAILDIKHMQLLDPLMVIFARGAMEQALSGDEKMADVALNTALVSNEAIGDFLVGLISIVHPAQINVLLDSYISKLRDEEDTSNNDRGPASWRLATTLRRARASRKLRLALATKVAIIPSFLALNYPLKFPSTPLRKKRSKSSWTQQVLSRLIIKSQTCPYPDGQERLPRAHWLAELLADECFKIGSACCAAVVEEAILQLKQQGSPGEYISRTDLLRLESMAIESISIIYDLLLRRHALDSRYQSEEARFRTVSMFVKPVMNRSIDGVHWLMRMESTHRVRLLWLLCLLHVLQQAPEQLIREQMRLYCIPKVSSFLRFLKLDLIYILLKYLENLIFCVSSRIILYINLSAYSSFVP